MKKETNSKELKNLKIEIRPIPGRDKIRSFSENLELFSQKHTVIPYINPSTRRYITGLTDEDKEYLESIGFNGNLSEEMVINGEPHPLWDSQNVKVDLLPTPIFLYPYRNPLDYIKWKFLLVSDYVYDSEKAMEEGGKTQATHFIYDESIELGIKATAIERRRKISEAFNKLTLDKKKNVLLVLLNEDFNNKNEDYVTIRFEDVINDYNKITALENLLDTGIEDIKLLAEIKVALRKNILRKTKQGIFLFDTNLGFSEKEVFDFITKPENQEILLKIKQQLQ